MQAKATGAPRAQTKARIDCKPASQTSIPRRRVCLLQASCQTICNISARIVCADQKNKAPLACTPFASSRSSRVLRRRSTPRGFEPLRAEPNGFRVHLLSRSDTVSCLRSAYVSAPPNLSIICRPPPRPNRSCRQSAARGSNGKITNAVLTLQPIVPGPMFLMTVAWALSS